MAPPWRDAVVLVTGASSGIGRELARQMAKEARGMALVARRADRLEELAKELREGAEIEVFVRATDLTDLDDSARMLDEVHEALGPIGVLVNNAGFGDMGAFDLAPWEKLERMIALNVTSLTFLTHRLYPSMVARRRGGILNLSSGFGLEFSPSFGAYVGTKHYVSGLTECLRLEAKPLGVTVTQVCPGPVATEFDEVLGNFTGHDVPGFVRIGASHCARSALRGFARGRALVVPGLAMKALLFVAARTPRWIKRIVMGFGASPLRTRQLASRVGPTSQ